MEYELKLGPKLIQRKCLPKRKHLQPAVEKEIERLTKTQHIGKAKIIDENTFVIPGVLTVKKGKLVKRAVDSRKLRDSGEQHTEAKIGGVDILKIQECQLLIQFQVKYMDDRNFSRVFPNE